MTLAKPNDGALVNPDHSLYASLVGAYLFQEGAGTTCKDSSGGNRNITLDLGSGTPISWGTSSIFTGNALIASPTAGTRVGDCSLLPAIPGGTSFSIEIWITVGSSDNYGTLFSENHIQGFWLHNNTPVLDTSSEYSANTTLTLGLNYQLVFTYDGTTLRFYINGVLDVASAVSMPDIAFDSIINSITSDTFVGTYDLLNVWSARVLTSTEVAAQYTNPFLMYVPTPAAASRPFVYPGPSFPVVYQVFESSPPRYRLELGRVGVLTYDTLWVKRIRIRAIEQIVGSTVVKLATIGPAFPIYEYIAGQANVDIVELIEEIWHGGISVVTLAPGATVFLELQ